jgi:acyl phosphate:glycerol-3-phosphate acyltransferase
LPEVIWLGLIWAGVVLLSYLIGTIPTAYLAARWLKGQDIRQVGDGNAGAANVARTVGARIGIAVGLVDIAKGAAAVLLTKWLLDSTVAEMIAGIAVIAGHNWPVYLQGRGGRGAATAVGVLLAMLPVLAIPLVVPGLIVLYFTKSTAKAVATFYIPLPFLAWPVGYSYTLAFYSLLIPVIVGLSHYFSVKRRGKWAGQSTIPSG